MEPDRQRLSAAERSNLVAYLDGELEEPLRHALASKLTLSPSARREVDVLQQTWSMLDFLAKPAAPPDLTSRTLTLATGVATLDERLTLAASRIGRLVGRWLVCGLAASLLFLLGSAAVRWMWPDPTARLARDLSLAEHLDEYRAVGSFEFLKQLDESADFARSGE